MAGLLGDSLEDPRTMAVLRLAGALQNQRGGGFGGLLSGLNAGGQDYIQTIAAAKQEEERRKQQQLQQQMMQQQLAQAQQQSAAQAEAARRQKAVEQAYRGAIRTPEQQAMQQHGGPTNAAAQAAPGMQPGVDPQALIRGLTEADPMAAFQMMQPKPEDMKVVGDALVGVSGGKARELYRAQPKPAELPTSVREFQYGQTNPEYNAWATGQKRAGATNVNVGLTQEREYSKAQGKEYSDLMGNITKQGFSAPTQLRKLERMTQLLDGVDGGKLAPTGLDVASGLNAIGIKIDPRLGNKEAAEALAREMAGSLRQPGTGPMTDKDFDNFLTQIPSLSKSAGGRKQITQTMQAALHRDVQVAKMAREYVKRNGQLDNGFMDEVSQFIAENPVIQAPKGWTVSR